MKELFLLVFAIFSFLLLSWFVFVLRFFTSKKKRLYLVLIAIGIDRLGAVVLYNKLGWTVSSITYFRYMKREKEKGLKKEYYYFMKFINTLFFDADHCKNAYFWEIRHRKNNTKRTRFKNAS